MTEVHHINGEGENAGVVYCEMQGRENGGESLSHLAMLREMYPGHCGYKVGSAMLKRSSASDLCSEGRVVRMWIPILAATVVIVSLTHFTVIASLHPGV